MESPEMHSVWLPEVKLEPEEQHEPASSDPLSLKVEPPPEPPAVKEEPEDAVNIECHPEIENLHEYDDTNHPPTSPPRTHASRLDTVSHGSSKTQREHFECREEVSERREFSANHSSLRCTVCNKVFSKRHHLTRHLLVHLDKRDHKCEECGKRFPVKDNLKQHLLIHAEPTHVCVHCKKAFARNHDYRRHLLTHSDILPDKKCDVCGKCFTTASYLRNHLRTHKPREYACSHCSMTFTRNDNLQRHVQTHSEVRDKKCAECGKCFITMNVLWAHVQTHKQSECVCAMCHKSFSSERNLKQHILSHTKPEQCDLCNKAFSQRKDLALHKTNHHAKKVKKVKTTKK